MLAIDLGNTTTKAALWDGDLWNVPPLATFRFPSVDEGHPAIVDDVARHSFDEVKIASVRDPALQALLRAWPAASPAPVILSHDSFALDLDVELPERVGVDRLAAAAAAVRSPLVPSIAGSIAVVDVGTAITIDRVDRGRNSRPVFRGGYILPGPQTSLNGLRAATHALPALNFAPTSASLRPGRSTVEAMQNGVAALLKAALTDLAEAVIEDADTGRVVAAVAAEAFPWLDARSSLVFDPALVLRGIAAAEAKAS